MHESNAVFAEALREQLQSFAVQLLRRGRVLFDVVDVIAEAHHGIARDVMLRPIHALGSAQRIAGVTQSLGQATLAAQVS